MNEETDTPETLADIIAEMRRFAAFAADRSRITPAPSIAAEQECHAAKLTKYADRIEAAAKREQQDAMKTAFLTKCKVCEKVGPAAAPGNAAAQREALEWAAQFVELGVDDDLGADGQNLTTAAEMARAALAAPARNCDRFQTEEEAYAAFMGLFDHFKGERHYQYCRWLFAPAEGGAE